MNLTVVLTNPSREELSIIQNSIAPEATLNKIIALSQSNVSPKRTDKKVDVFHCPKFFSTDIIEKIIEQTSTEYIIFVREKGLFRWLRCMPGRLEKMFKTTGAGLIYSHYLAKKGPSNKTIFLPPFQKGSARDTFPLGPVVVIDVKKARKVMKNMYPLKPGRYSGFFQLLLSLALHDQIMLVPEVLYEFEYKDALSQEEEHFNYLLEEEKKQKEAEEAFTAYLKKIDAFIEEPSEALPHEKKDFPVEASIVIPVKNRAQTIKDTLVSALSQKAGFKFNVIVVDNHSTDDTSDILRSFSEKDNRLKVICPSEKGLGIGGCWQLAVESSSCGRYALQLDSDDVYSSETSLETMIQAIKAGPYAMAVGTYRVTNANLKEIPPGIVSHKEWTRKNGHNNLLRVKGVGAPRCYYVPALREVGFPNVSYGEDYAVALEMNRRWPLVRVMDVVYLCRRWENNSDAVLTPELFVNHHMYKDFLRSCEISKRQQINKYLNKNLASE